LFQFIQRGGDISNHLKSYQLVLFTSIYNYGACYHLLVIVELNEGEENAHAQKKVKESRPKGYFGLVRN